MNEHFTEKYYYLLQLSWGCLQNLGGFVHFLLHLRAPHAFYRKAIVTLWKKDKSAAVGMFIFLGVKDQTYYAKGKERRHFRVRELSPSLKKVLVHEYGHTLQSVLLGPAFLPLIALPSTLWAACGKPVRKLFHISYYAFFPEKWANRIGSKVTGEEAPDW